MPANVSVIGRTTRVQGRVTGAVDLEVLGFVDGEISVDGDVTVDASGMVGAAVHARRLVVRGAVKGDLVGTESVLLEDGARVVGDVRAPRVAIAPGALVRGFVETGDAKASAPRAVRGTQIIANTPKPVAASPAKPVAAPAVKPPMKPVPVVHAAPAHVPPPAPASTNHTGPRRPPPPVVPALKKAKGQIAKKKER